METAQSLIDGVEVKEWDKEALQKKFYPEKKVKSSSFNTPAQPNKKDSPQGFRFAYKGIQKPTAEQVVGEL